MSTGFFTNQGDQTLLRKFQGVFESNTDIEWFDTLVGFLRASGYFAIRPFLGNVPTSASWSASTLTPYPLQQANAAPVTAGVARPLDTAPDIILSGSFDHPES